MNSPSPEPRCMLWVDGVGGYLVCLSDRVRLGQAVSGSGIEIPVMGDLSRHHVTLVRQEEGYLLEALAQATVGGRRVSGPHPLVDGDVIRLGSSFMMRFRQPHPLSATSRLEFLSPHRTQPAADGVLLMAASCLIGRGSNHHVVCRQWSHDVVLVRQGQSLSCHSSVPFEVDGRPYDRRGPVTLDSRIQGTDFCLSLERID